MRAPEPPDLDEGNMVFSGICDGKTPISLRCFSSKQSTNPLMLQKYLPGLVNCYIAIENCPVEIVDLPNLKMVMFHSYANVYHFGYPGPDEHPLISCAGNPRNRTSFWHRGRGCPQLENALLRFMWTAVPIYDDHRLDEYCFKNVNLKCSLKKSRDPFVGTLCVSVSIM